MRPIHIFFSYAHYDEDLMNEVRRQLSIHERMGRIVKWHDRQIPPGSEWKKLIDHRLQEAQIILLFVSPHFLDSNYCYEIEGRDALARHYLGEARVIPIILRPCLWKATPFSELEVLPLNGKAITEWENRDRVTCDVAESVMSVVDEVAAILEKSVSGFDQAGKLCTAYKTFLTSLNQQKVKYMVVGGVASQIHGKKEKTFDLDVWIGYDESNRKLLLAALISLGFLDAKNILIKNEAKDGHISILRGHNTAIDLNLELAINDQDFYKLYPNRYKAKIEGTSVDTISIEDMKDCAPERKSKGI